MNSTHDQAQYILTMQNTPTVACQKILERFGINSDQSLAGIIEDTQRAWLRPAGTERWQLQETFSLHEKLQLIMLFKHAGLFSVQVPQYDFYDYFLLMGGDALGMVERLDFMIRIWDKGMRTQNIIFLTSERELDPIHEANEPGHTECGLLQIVYARTLHTYQKKSLPVTFINTPNQIRNGKSCRATTGDTIIEWLKDKPHSGSCLIITSQPLIGYQESVARTLLDEKFSIESCGPHADNAVSTAEFLDTLARWLYQEGLRRKII